MVDGGWVLPGSERTVHISSASFPIDIGVIRIPRPARREVLVLGHVDNSWRPIWAALKSPNGFLTTDSDGRAAMTAGPGDALDVVAAGFEFVRTCVDASTGDGPMVIRL